MGESIIKIIEGSFKIYKKNFRKIITPFAILGVISLIITFGVLFGYFAFIFAGQGGDLGQIGNNPTQILNLINQIQENLVPLLIGGGLILLIITIITSMLEFSTYKPINELLHKKKASDWKSNFKPQFMNAIKVIIAGIIIAIPMILGFFIFGYGIINIVTNPGMMIASFGVFAVLMIIQIIIGILSFFTTYNIIIKKTGIIKSIKKSIGTVKNNVGTCLIFLILWGVINVVVSGIGQAPCIGFIIQIVIQFGLVIPVYVFSYIMLGNKLVK